MEALMGSGTFRSPLKEINSPEEFVIRSRLRSLSHRIQAENVKPERTSEKQIDISQLQENLQSVTSSLSLLSETIGNALAESFNLLESKNCYMSASPSSQASQCITNISSPPGLDDSPKPSRDLAMAMTSKAKLLLRELKAVKAELAFMKERTAQVEEENRKLRGNMEKQDEDDLVRIQLETLLAEKARLVQENATYKRENQFLHEAIEYHQLTVQRMVDPRL